MDLKVHRQCSSGLAPSVPHGVAGRRGDGPWCGDAEELEAGGSGHVAGDGGRVAGEAGWTAGKASMRSPAAGRRGRSPAGGLHGSRRVREEERCRWRRWEGDDGVDGVRGGRRVDPGAAGSGPWRRSGSGPGSMR